MNGEGRLVDEIRRDLLKLGRIEQVASTGEKSIQNANVTIRWTLPNGSTKTMTAITNSSGQAKFTVSSTRGKYTLTVTNVTKSGYVFDTVVSILSKSITK